LGLEILSHGYEKPENSTTGAQWFPAMERNIQRMNDHTHDGLDGAQIGANLQNVLAANWGADLGGTSFRQEVIMPNPLEFDTSRIEVRRSTGEMVYPTIVKTAANKFYLYTNDNTAEYVVSYV
jgi:hypothetical protein